MPNRLVEVVTTLISVREVPDSNFGPKTDYHEFFPLFSLTLPGKCREITSTFFPIRYSL
jgi:hypothetical protein